MYTDTPTDGELTERDIKNVMKALNEKLDKIIQRIDKLENIIGSKWWDGNVS